MTAALAKLAKIILSASMSDKDKAIKVVGFLVLSPLLFIGLFFIGGTIYKTVPMATPEQIEMYKDVCNEKAKEIATILEEQGEENGTFDSFLDEYKVNWQHVLATDAVYLQQDFEKADKEHIKEMVKRFIKESEKEITYTVKVYKIIYLRDENGDYIYDENGVIITRTIETEEVRKKTINVFSIKSLEDVLNELNLDKEEVDYYLTFDLEQFAYAELDLPANWKPNPDSLYEWPIPGIYEISDPYGYRIHPITKENDFHKGIDIPAPLGTKVVAVKDGTILLAEEDNTAGKTIIIDHLDGSRSKYFHLQSYMVNVGDRVTKGQVIATVGNTGRSTGPHLHFEIIEASKSIDPMVYFK